MTDWDLTDLPERMFDLSDQVALVVGGAGGLGRPTALAMAEFGADVVVTSRSIDELREVRDDIETQTGSNATAIQTDVTNEDDVVSLVEQVVDEYGRIDSMINYAGMNIPQPAEDFSFEDWRQIQRVNVDGTFLVAREVGKVMKEQGDGSIINVSSVRGGFALPENYLGYCASKGAVNMVTKQLACEWGKYGINVNAIAPTVIETEITEHLVADEDFAEKLRRGIPLGRWGQPEDLAGAVIFFASDASQFVTGQILYIDGGTTTFDSID